MLDDKGDAEAVEEQIRSLQRDVEYQVREYPIEVVVQKFKNGEDEDLNELFVPDYQRELVWSEEHQSKFIESLLIGLPIPYIFVADVRDELDPEKSGRLEIVDGTQRIRTLARFMSGQLCLIKLKKLDKANGSHFSDLTLPRQRRFRRLTIRMIELTENTTEETRRDMFERINTGTVRLNPMEERRGAHQGPFIDLVSDLAKDPRFKRLAPMSQSSEKRFEREELVARFFAYQNYLEFGKDGKKISDFVDEYTKQANVLLAEDDTGAAATDLREKWESMLAFIERNFPTIGFAKSPTSKSTPRVRFESIAVGASLALEIKPDLKPSRVESWLDSPEFKKLTTSDAANNQKKVVDRIEYVRDRLLGP
ncbi:MAG: DUF262 domain-containing protein [Candidatus Eremiobacteraeota bacterium]|nr:DUF262 domain-containing protein [Candidatus Eremiobacteraeota bacterium]